MFTVGGKKDQAKARGRLKSAGPKSAQKPLGPSARLAKLSMYADAPSADVAIEDFELYALDRMRVLKAIETNKKGTRVSVSLIDCANPRREHEHPMPERAPAVAIERRLEANMSFEQRQRYAVTLFAGRSDCTAVLCSASAR